jgi:transposase-like protein
MPNEAGGYTVGMRKTYDKDFKAKVALEALRGDKTIQYNEPKKSDGLRD